MSNEPLAPGRRQLIGTAFAAAALPVCAQTQIKTPHDGLLAGEISVDADGFAMPANSRTPQR